MSDSSWTRRRLLCQVGAVAGALVAGSRLKRLSMSASQPLTARAATSQPLRIGVVVPSRTGLTPVRAASQQVAGQAALQGAIMAGEELGQVAGMLDKQLEVLVSSAPTAEAAKRAAERLVDLEGVFALVGGFDVATCQALSGVADEAEVPFLNIGCASDALRGASCRRFTFHFEASAAMYLDALADWFVREGIRRWFFVTAATDEGRALLARGRYALERRHWGGKEAGSAEVREDEPEFGRALDAIARARPDLVVLLLGAVAQLDFLGQYEAAGLSYPVTGFPEAVAQTRTFFAAARNAAPRAGAGHRAVLWEASLDDYGGRELNARYRERWGMPMDPSAWAAWEAVKILWEAASFAGTTDGRALVQYLEAPDTTFDVHKGIGVSFRPWDHQLRQTLYLVKVNDRAESAWDLATLAGELPETHRPGFSPNEMLDQIGDLANRSQCRFGSGSSGR